MSLIALFSGLISGSAFFKEDCSDQMLGSGIAVWIIRLLHFSSWNIAATWPLINICCIGPTRRIVIWSLCPRWHPIPHRVLVKSNALYRKYQGAIWDTHGAMFRLRRQLGATVNRIFSLAFKAPVFHLYFKSSGRSEHTNTHTAAHLPYQNRPRTEFQCI